MPLTAPAPGASLRVRRWSHATFEASAADGDASVGCLGEGGWRGEMGEYLEEAGEFHHGLGMFGVKIILWIL